MVEQLKPSITRIRLSNNTETVVGAGFQIDKDYVLTCAHVISQASGIKIGDIIPEQIEIYLDFPFIRPGNLLKANIVLWKPENDIALLELLSILKGTQSASMIPADDLWEHQFRVHGFPVGRSDGVWATGRLCGENSLGRLQIEDIKGPGYRVQPGFSGSPVWDSNLDAVVGMVVASEVQPEIKAAYIIPAYSLLSILIQFHFQVIFHFLASQNCIFLILLSK